MPDMDEAMARAVDIGENEVRYAYKFECPMWRFSSIYSFLFFFWVKQNYILMFLKG